VSRGVTRFVLWGLAFAVVVIVWLVDALDLDVDVLLEYLLGSAVLVGASALAAVLVVAIARWFRR
jgi:hypothetical protein